MARRVDESEHIANANTNSRDDRLDSWKKIASYLKRDVSTVQRWERRECLPVHRHLHDKQGSVFAFRSELDVWWESRRSGLGNTEVPPDAPPTAAPTTSSAAAPRTRWLLVGLAGAAVAGLLGWMIVLQRQEPWRNPLDESRFTRLADYPGHTQAAAISRDGQRIAFLGDSDGQTDLWAGTPGDSVYRNLTRGQALELVNPSIRTLGFTPDGALVSMWTRGSDGSRPGDINIVAIPASGGQVAPYLPGVAEYQWSHDGQRLVFHTTAPGDPLYVRAAGGKDTKIYAGEAGVHCHFPAWSMDDDYIYFVRGVPPDDWDLWRIRPSGAQPQRLTHHDSRLSYPVVLDRRSLAYLATDADGSGPWMYVLDLASLRTHRISSALQSFTSLAGSADGSKLVATVSSPRDSLWRVPLASQSGPATPASAPVQLVANAAAPRLSAGTLVYLSSAGGTEGIWVRHGAEAHEIWRSARVHITSAPAISDDGRRIAFAASEQGRTVLNVVDLDGSHLARITDSLLLRGGITWFPDGQSLLTAVVRSGEPKLTRIFVNGDPPAAFVADYSIDPVWSEDRRFVVYSGADIGTTFPLRAAAPDGRPYPIAGIMLTRGARRVAFYPASTSLVVLDGEIGHKNFWLLDPATGVKRLLAQLPADTQVRDFDVSATRGEIVFDRTEAASEMALIERTPAKAGL